MVGPVSESDRQAFQRKLQVGVAALVAVSGALTAVQADAGPTLVGVATVAGAGVGWALAWFIFPSGPSPVERQRQRQQAGPDNPFAEDETEDAEPDRPPRARQE